MDHEHGYQNTTPRRSFLRAVGGTVAAGTLVSTAGCLDLLFGRSGPGATVPGGQIPHRQEFTREDADVVATTPNELQRHASAGDGRIIWIPNGVEIDMTGRDLVVEGAVIASGRGDGSPGGAIRTDDEGKDSPVWFGGSNHRGLIELRNDARITGVRILGPHHSEQEHPAFSGYIPMASASTKAARDRVRSRRYARAISVTGDRVTIDNCEIAYFSVQAVAIGTSSHTPVETVIAHSHIHNCAMEALGYGVDVRHGDPLISQCYFNATRHSINGSGMADSSYRVVNCTFGPMTAGHITDQHAVKDNVSGSSDRSARDYRHRAGGRMLVRGCEFMTAQVPDLGFLHRSGSSTPHATIRAVPDDGFYFEDNLCSHSSLTSAVTQRGVPGSYPRDENDFTRIYASGNQFNVDFSSESGTPQEQS